MKLIYTHENRLLVENARNLLQTQNIEVLLKNEYALGALGEAAPIETWLELWLVDEADYPRAMDVLDSSLSAQGASPWECPHCGESNDPSFELCWQCGAENPALTAKPYP